MLALTRGKRMERMEMELHGNVGTSCQLRETALSRCVSRYDYRESWLFQRVLLGTEHGNRILTHDVLKAQEGHVYLTCVMSASDILCSIGIVDGEGLGIHQRVFPRSSKEAMYSLFSMVWRFSLSRCVVHFWGNALFFHEYSIFWVRSFLNKSDTLFCGDLSMIERQILYFERENSNTSELLELAESTTDVIVQCLKRSEVLESGRWDVLSLMFSQHFNHPVRRFMQ